MSAGPTSAPLPTEVRPRMKPSTAPIAIVAQRRPPSTTAVSRSCAMWKYNPLVDWTEREVWSRIFERDLPYHPLHDHGYESIGCATCTLPGAGRAGRWAGTDKTECGLHV